MFRLALIAPVLCGLGSACQGSQADLNRGDQVPMRLRTPGQPALVIAARTDDCLGCRLNGVYHALRTLRGAEGDSAPIIIVLAMTSDGADSTIFRHTLLRERIDARIELLSPEEGRRILDWGRLPAIYFIRNGRVIGEWEAPQAGGAVVIPREGLLTAVRASASAQDSAP